MGIRVYKPTSPGRRNSSVSDFAELTDKNKKPEKIADRAAPEDGGPEQPGVHHRAAPRRRPQADVSDHRLGPQRSRRPGGGRDPHRVRPEPVGADRLDPVRGRREAVHPGARGPQGRHERRQRARRRAQAGQLPAAGQDPDRACRSTTSRCSRAAAASSAARPASGQS